MVIRFIPFNYSKQCPSFQKHKKEAILNTFSSDSSLFKGISAPLQIRELKKGENIFHQQINSEYIIYKQLQFSVIEGEIPYPSYAVICRSDGAVAVIPHNVLGNFYFNTFKEMIAPVFTKSIKNLLNIRNHLLLQLDLECGNISEEYFDKEEPKYLSEVKKVPFDKLKEEIKLLFNFTNLSFDSSDISEILNCPVDDIEKVLKILF